jgi:hypothetical protein
MIRILLRATVLAGLLSVSAADAADMRMPVKAPPAAYAYNWSDDSELN